MTLRAYTDVLRFEDNLWGEQYYFVAAKGIIQIYLHLHDHPAITEEEKEPDYSGMTAAQRKKAKAIARKKKNQAEKKEAERRQKEAEAAENGGSKKKGKVPVDEDPDGKELMKKDPLEEAKKYTSILAKYSPGRFETWTLQYDVSIRRKKTMLALQALYKLRQLDSAHPEFFSRVVDFAVRIPEISDIPAPVKVVMDEEFAVLLGGKSIADFVSEAADKVKQGGNASLPSRVAIAQGLVATNPSTAGAAASIIVTGGVDGLGVSVATCNAALNALKAFGPPAEASTKQWTATVKERFPLHANFS